MRPQVVPYATEWRERGAALTAELLAALGPLALRADHIGSTAIDGMAAKPVLDVQISVADLEAAAKAFAAPLAARGFTQRPYVRDHAPAGRPDDAVAWAKRFWTRPGEVNLHVRVAGAPNERLALLFRDWFRAHPEAVAAYGRFKLLLAEAVPEIEPYTSIKDPIVDVVIVAAEEWAAATGWRPDMSDRLSEGPLSRRLGPA